MRTVSRKMKRLEHVVQHRAQALSLSMECLCSSRKDGAFVEGKKLTCCGEEDTVVIYDPECQLHSDGECCKTVVGCFVQVIEPMLIPHADRNLIVHVLLIMKRIEIV